MLACKYINTYKPTSKVTTADQHHTIKPRKGYTAPRNYRTKSNNSSHKSHFEFATSPQTQSQVSETNCKLYSHKYRHSKNTYRRSTKYFPPPFTPHHIVPIPYNDSIVVVYIHCGAAPISQQLCFTFSSAFLPLFYKNVREKFFMVYRATWSCYVLCRQAAFISVHIYV